MATLVLTGLAIFLFLLFLLTFQILFGWQVLIRLIFFIVVMYYANFKSTAILAGMSLIVSGVWCVVCGVW